MHATEFIASAAKMMSEEKIAPALGAAAQAAQEEATVSTAA